MIREKRVRYINIEIMTFTPTSFRLRILRLAMIIVTYVVGSSRNSIDGLVISSNAMDSLFFWPPESRLAIVSA